LYVRFEKWPLAREIFERMTPLLSSESPSALYETALFQLAEIYTHLNENVLAIKTYQQLLSVAPKKTTAILNLVLLQEKQGAFQEMVSLLKNLLLEGSFTSEEEGKALWFLGKAFMALGEYAQTQQTLQRCIHKNYAPLDCWTLLTEAQLKSSQFKDAIESLQKKIPLLEQLQLMPQELAEKKNQIWFQIGDIYAYSLQETEQAVQSYQTALTHSPHSLQTIEALGKILESEKSWEALIQNFENFVAKLPAKEIQKSMGLHLKMGQVKREQLQQPQKALGHFKAVLQLDSHHYAAHLAVAQIQSSDENAFVEAIQEHLYLLKKDPCLLDSYHSLGKIFKQQGKKAEYFSICQALALFKDIQKDELSFYNSQRTAMVLNSARILEPELREEYLLRDLKNNLLRKLLQLTNDSMEKAFPPNWEAYNVRKKDRLTPETSPLLYKIFSEIKAILKLGEVVVYLTEMKLPQPVLEATAPPTLIVPQHLLTELSLEELYCAIARQLFFVADNQILLSKLSEEQLESYFQYLSANDVLQENNRETQKRVKNSVSRKIKKDLDELMAQYQAQANQISIRDYRKKLYAIANRVGWLFSNSLPHTVRFLSKLEQKTGFNNYSTTQLLEIVQNWPEIQDLLHFGLSPEMLKLRQTLGWTF
ncbi:MAG: tetratricopeptide repeat protein, partial [Planctomycetota bacterium]